MAHWYRLELGDAQTGFLACQELSVRAEAAFRAADCPALWNMYSRHENEGRLHCVLCVYFSPAAADFARELGANRCAAPALATLEWCAGAPQDASRK